MDPLTIGNFMPISSINAIDQIEIDLEQIQEELVLEPTQEDFVWEAAITAPQVWNFTTWEENSIHQVDLETHIHQAEHSLNIHLAEVFLLVTEW